MLDPDHINRAAPPGSMRYFALLYTSAAQRDLLTALFVIEAEIRASTCAAHEVAHTRLQWWRGEVDRLTNCSAQHPATKVLQAALPTANFALLHDLLTAADMELARMTFASQPELNAYLELSGGTIFALVGDQSMHAQLRKVGALIRRVEALRDLSTDVRAGRIFWPLDALSAHEIPPERLAETVHAAKFRVLLETECARMQSTLAHAEIPKAYSLSRPLAVLAALHAKLAQGIARSSESAFTARQELSALGKVWVAWRAARRT